MNINSFFSIIVCATLFIRCENDTTSSNNTGTIDTVNADFNKEITSGTCFAGIAFYEKEDVLINTDSAYRAFEDSIRMSHVNKNCDTAHLPSIDFNDFTLLGKLTSGGGCNADYSRYIIKNDQTKTYTYHIKVEYDGLCEMLIFNWNWAIVPEIPENYKVVFEVDEIKNQ